MSKHKDELRAKMQANTPKPKRLGSDPFSSTASGLDLLITNTQDQQPLTVKPTDLTKPKRGRPKEIHRTITKASQNGLHDGWTRATFIVKEDGCAVNCVRPICAKNLHKVAHSGEQRRMKPKKEEGRICKMSVYVAHDL